VDSLISVSPNTRIWGGVIFKEAHRSLMGQILVNASRASRSCIGRKLYGIDPDIPEACVDSLISVSPNTRIWGGVIFKEAHRSLLPQILVNAS
jgi:hypothetical protein